MRLLIIVILVVLTSTNVNAHHSNAPHFDTDIEVTNTGIVTDWKFVNPHAFIYFDVQNTDGSISSWRCETDSAASMKRRGYTNETFTIGETITIIGNPARREDNHCFFRDFVFSDGTEVNRTTDVSLLDREKTQNLTENSTQTVATVLLGNEPDISGFWWDGDEEQAPPAGLTPAPPQGMTGMGMGMGMGGSRQERIAAIGLTPAGQAIQDKYERIYDDPALHCEISNIIDALGRDESVNEIRQNGDTITILYGYMDYLRTIYLNVDKHPENITPTPGGHSIGTWQDGTLVVDTVGFTPSVLNAQVGAPTSESFHVVERFTYDQTSQELIREYTATDPENWTDSYTGRDAYRRSKVPYTPYDCQTLSGINNLRPGTPEYNAELEKIGSSSANISPSESIAPEDSSFNMLTILFMAGAILLLTLVGIKLKK